MILFTEMVLFTRMGWGWEKRLRQKKGNERKKIPVWLPSHPFFYDMEADCFPVNENAENKPESS